MKEVLEINNVVKYYGDRGNVSKILDNISFTVEEGEFIVIMGPSGSGKTTLLNCISSIEKVSGGSIKINSSEVTSFNSKKAIEFRRNKLGLIYQDSGLLDTLNGYDNIALALTITKVKKDVIFEKIKDLSKKLELEKILYKFPSQMSGGEKQKIAAARAIIRDPLLILGDEPTGALDSKSSKALLESLEKLNKEVNSTILMVTHDIYCASFANRILFIKDGKIFNELVKGRDSRKDFFNRIIEVETLLGGDTELIF